MWGRACLALAAVSAVFLTLATLAPAAPTSTPTPIRFWLDAYGYAPGETSILLELLASGKVPNSPHTLSLAGLSTSSGPLSPKGYWQPPGAWSVYFAPRAACARAWPALTPSQVVTCVPGLGNSLASKPALAAALSAAFGDASADDHHPWPPAFPLPDRFWDWLAYAGARQGIHPLWAVKSRVHRGVGVAVAPLSTSAAAAAAAAAPWRSKANTPPPPAVAQAFVSPQVRAAGGRPFYVRVWAVVAVGGGQGGPSPGFQPAPRLYLAPGGFAIFGEPAPSTRLAANASSNADSASVVNMWLIKPADAVVWSLADLLAASPAPAVVVRGVRAALASALAAATPSLMAASAARPSAGLGLELIGADFVLSAPGWEPRLVEINALPSIARLDKGGPRGRLSAVARLFARPPPAAAAFDGAKQVLVSAYVRLLAARAAAGGRAEEGLSPHCRAEAAALPPSAAALLPSLVGEAADAVQSGFQPLMEEVVAARRAVRAGGGRRGGGRGGGLCGRGLAAVLAPWPAALVAAGRVAGALGWAGRPLPAPLPLPRGAERLEAALAACVGEGRG